MSEADGPVEPEFHEASLKLDQGLRSCRAVLSSYRLLLTEHRTIANDDDEADGSVADTAGA